MIKALAPGMRRGCSWVWLWVVLAGVFAGSSSLAQDTKAPGATKPAEAASKKAAAKPEPAAKKAAAPDAKKAAPAADAPKDTAATKDEAKKEDEPAKKEKEGGVEVFKDPRAEAALKIFKTIPGYRDIPPQQIAAVKQMAAGTAAVDSDAILRFVQAMALRLSDRSNINGLLNPPPGGRPTRAIQEATDNLLDALNTAKLAKNTAFLTEYNKALIATLPKLLDGNLISRIQAIIVLGQTGSPAALPIFLEQLKNPKQTVWVKSWAARGITLLVENGTRVDAAISAQDAINAAKVLSDFLENEKDAPWFVQMRALEAIGSLRQSAASSNLQKVEIASTAMKFLADPQARPEVRAEAARALGLLRVNPAVARYNHGLIAYEIGLLAAQIGEMINETFTANPTRSNYLTGLLVTQLYQAFNGIEGARESGLLKVPGSNPTQNGARQIADLTASIAKAAVDLVRAPTGQIPARRKDLGERVAALKSYLDKNPPKDFHLVPGGPEFRAANAAAVAGEPAEKARVAGAPGGQ